ncbi:MAG TPA: HPr family phosphocarrier protein [Ktedonobacterales bacterium]|jgi:phosphocarrier protein|nr:HPr family phosphocarrier protein [Ktedonobacterales bacterium]
MTSNEVTLQDPAGLHARPAALFVKAASRFSSVITVHVGDKRANAKSIMDVLKLSARQGATITITADGADEAEAVAALSALASGDIAGGATAQ